MATETKSAPQDKASPYEISFKKDYLADWEIHQNYIQGFDPLEAMLQGQVYDSVSKSVDGSKITDSYATTLAKERADRVMAKLPEGETQSTGRSDVGKAAFMDILRQKWVYPNANAQHPFFEKLNMWQLYSSVYGYMPMFYDWNVSTTGYVGPDCWLWNPRNLVPQQGRVSIKDMDYVTALTWVGKKFIQGIIDAHAKDDKNTQVDGEVADDGWDIAALQELVEKADDPVSPDTQQDTNIQRTRTPQSTRKGICLATRYEAGEDGDWCTFAPDHGYIEVRRLKNPHKNGRIPFVIKYSQPLFDSFYGLGDFQRAMPLQFARDGLTNFYFTGIKNNLVPPIVVNANGVMKHTVDYRAGGVMMETIPNSIRVLETSNAGLATYQAAQSNLTGSLLSMFGSQNASIPGAEALNPSQGKTPAAINMYSDKEATRDGAERRHMEEAIEELTDGFNTLIVNIGTEEVPVQLFADDIQELIEQGYTDLQGLFKNFTADESGTAGDLKIDPAQLKGVEYRFNINPNSTAKTNKDEQLNLLKDLMTNIGKFQNLFKDDPRIDVNWAKMMETYESISGVKGANQFITMKPGPTPQELKAQQEQQKQEAQAQQARESLSMAYKDVPEDVKRQMEARAGFTPSQLPPPAQPQDITSPTVSRSGHMFNDPTLAKVADSIHAM